jgi:hypothetical protein
MLSLINQIFKKNSISYVITYTIFNLQIATLSKPTANYESNYNSDNDILKNNLIVFIYIQLNLVSFQLNYAYVCNFFILKLFFRIILLVYM